MEAGCLWLGERMANGDTKVQGVIAPKQINHPQNYSIAANAMQEVAAIARPRQWTLVASVHSHPGSSVEHSVYDDEMSPSRSALSIVFANYGLLSENWPVGVGVHEYIDDYWHLLPGENSAKRVVFNDDVDFNFFDLR